MFNAVSKIVFWTGGTLFMQQLLMKLIIALMYVGLEAFSFDYVVKWPVSLILSKKVRI